MSDSKSRSSSAEEEAVVEEDDESVGISVQNLRKTFDSGEIVAVDNANIEVRPDEFVTLLGPSGCGKTTTLRCIAGLIKPDEGDIYIGDRNVSNEAPKDRDLAFVFQENTLFPHMSVRENIRFGLDRTTDLSIEEKNRRVEEVAEALGIDDFLESQPYDLSGGQQQRVSIGRAMVMEPAAFLLDEPFSDLDANLRSEMQTEIQQLQRNLARPMIFVTHNQEEAMTISDKIVVMNKGEIQQIDSPHNIYTDPDNLFVANFIGSQANRFDSKVDEKGSGLKITNSAFSTEPPKGMAKDLSDYISEEIVVSIRQSDVNVIESPAAEWEVILIESKGGYDTLFLSSNDVELRSEVPIGHGIKEGDVVDIEIERDKLMAFDPSGERIV